jgi:Chemotaxis phosphatase CheX
MSQALSSERWLGAAVTAAIELAQTTFNRTGGEATPLAAVPSDREGSLLPLYHGEESLQLGILGSREACVALTKAFLGLEEEDEPAQGDVPDTVGEIINIIGGMVQRSVSDEAGQTVALGYPVHFLGNLVTTSSVETFVARMDMGPAETEVVLIRPRPNPPGQVKQPLFRKRR